MIGDTFFESVSFFLPSSDLYYLYLYPLDLCLFTSIVCFDNRQLFAPEEAGRKWKANVKVSWLQGYFGFGGAY